MLIFSPSNLELLLTETNTQNHTQTRTHLDKHIRDRPSWQWIGSYCQRCLFAKLSTQAERGEKKKSECGRQNKRSGEMMKDQNKSGQSRASRERQMWNRWIWWRINKSVHSSESQMVEKGTSAVCCLFFVFGFEESFVAGTWSMVIKPRRLWWKVLQYCGILI